MKLNESRTWPEINSLSSQKGEKLSGVMMRALEWCLHLFEFRTPEILKPLLEVCVRTGV